MLSIFLIAKFREIRNLSGGKNTIFFFFQKITLSYVLYNFIDYSVQILIKIREIFKIDISQSCEIYNNHREKLFETQSSLQISYST